MQNLSSFVFEAGRGRPRKNRDIETIDPENLDDKELKSIEKKLTITSQTAPFQPLVLFIAVCG